jgi:predicted DsbA family dithiol-disulfide isomerase
MPAPLPPTASGFFVTPPGRSVTIDMFLDIICPFSCKMLLTLLGSVCEKFADRVTFVLHQVPQPWHPQGSYVHEAALAVRATSPDKYVSYVRSLMTAHVEQQKFSDEATWEKTRPQIYEELLDMAAACGADRVAAGALLANTGQGTGATQSLKWAVKFHRTRGVHVTPTVHVNGLEAGVVSSGWAAEQWEKFLGPMGSDNFTGS